MSIKSRLYPVLAPVFNGDVFRDRVPDIEATRIFDGDLPFAVYTVVGGTSFQNIEGDIDLSQPRVQISIYTITDQDLDTLQDALKAAMKGANALALATLAAGGDPVTTEGAVLNYSASEPVAAPYETDTRRVGIHADFYCWHI